MWRSNDLHDEIKDSILNHVQYVEKFYDYKIKRD
jgi:hypothetical protein